MESKDNHPIMIVKPIDQGLQLFTSSKILEEAGVKLAEVKRPGLRQILSGLKWGLDWNPWDIFRRGQ